MRDAPAVVVTNFNANFTGVSATAAAVTARLCERTDVLLCGVDLPGLPRARGLRPALAFTRERAAETGRPVVWHVRRNSEMFTGIVLRHLLRRPIRLVFTSAAIRLHSFVPRLLISAMDAVIATTEKAAGFVPHVAAVVPHGVDVETFRPAEDRAAAWSQAGYPGEAGIAAVGRIRPEKGTDRFVSAMIELLPRHPGLTALVIGRASHQHARFEADLRDRVARAGLSGRIVFTGEIAPRELAATMRALTLLVAPPRYEGYGMTVLEAMASGVPVVATKTGAFADFLAAGDAGILVPNEDGAALVSAIGNLLADRKRLEDLSRTARARAVADFAIDREADGIEAVYRRVTQPGWSRAAAGRGRDGT